MPLTNIFPTSRLRPHSAFDKDVVSSALLMAHNIGAGGTAEFIPAASPQRDFGTGSNKRFWQKRHRSARAFGIQEAETNFHPDAFKGE